MISKTTTKTVITFSKADIEDALREYIEGSGYGYKDLPIDVDFRVSIDAIGTPTGAKVIWEE